MSGKGDKGAGPRAAKRYGRPFYPEYSSGTAGHVMIVKPFQREYAEKAARSRQQKDSRSWNGISRRHASGAAQVSLCRYINGIDPDELAEGCREAPPEALKGKR